MPLPLLGGWVQFSCLSATISLHPASAHKTQLLKGKTRYLAIPCGVLHASLIQLDGDAALPFQVHAIQELSLRRYSMLRLMQC